MMILAIMKFKREWTILRISRITRIFRVVRMVHSLLNFRMMILAIIKSVDMLLWVFFVILCFLYIFSVIFMQGATDYFKDEGLHTDDAIAIKDLFGDMLSAMLTLFETITGGRDWHEVVVALMHMHWA